VATTNQPENILSRIRDLEKQIKELRARTLAGAVISHGALEVRDPTDGHVIMRTGVWDYGGGPVPGFAIFRNDGSTAFWSFDTGAGNGYLTIYDEQQNEVIRPDTVAGQGLATPYITDPATPWSRVTTPPETTTSGTFVALWRLHRVKQHPRIRVQMVVKNGADTAGEIRLTVAGNVVSLVLTPPAGTYAYMSLYGTIPGAHWADVHVDVEARRTAGTGSVGVEVVNVQGVGSA
jgi:hypothetical protein